MRTHLLALGLILSSPALARDATFADNGVTLDPYTRSAVVTTGRAEGFRQLYADAHAFADKLVPAAPIVVEPITPPVAAVAVEPAPADPAAGQPSPEVVPAPPAPRATAPSLPPRGDLHIHNETSAYADISINGQKFARIGPMDAAVLHDVKTGHYDVTFVHPHGFTWTTRATTAAPTR